MIKQEGETWKNKPVLNFKYLKEKPKERRQRGEKYTATMPIGSGGALIRGCCPLISWALGWEVGGKGQTLDLSLPCRPLFTLMMSLLLVAFIKLCRHSLYPSAIHWHSNSCLIILVVLYAKLKKSPCA